MHSLDMMRPSTAAAVAPVGRDREVINLADDEDEESDRNVALMNNDVLDEEVLRPNNNGTYAHCNSIIILLLHKNTRRITYSTFTTFK